jgi:hypothetical protein
MRLVKNFYKERLRPGLKPFLRKLGLLDTAEWLWRLIVPVFKPEIRKAVFEYNQREQLNRERFLQFKKQNGKLFKHSLNRFSPKKKVLIGGIGFPQVEIELGLIKALEMAGYTPVVLIEPANPNIKFYKLAGVKEFIFLSDMIGNPDLAMAEEVIKNIHTIEDLLKLEFADARVGKVAITTSFRELRVSTLDLESVQDRQIILKYLAASMGVATAAHRILLQSQADLALIWDGVYTPKGELFDVCLARGIDVIIWENAHRSSTLILKRFNLENRNEQYNSLSQKSWDLIKAMRWTDSQHEQLQHELYNTYANGDWYPSAGTQFSKRLVDVPEITSRLGLDPGKKTAMIFPHIFWDGSFTSGADLFRSYEEWFIETVRVACSNRQVNWVIKIHPAQVLKNKMENYVGTPAEVVVLQQHFGNLPPHIFMIPADNDISTFSLFELMDYCITVRGTIGIEAARWGIPVLTAGTGRYDRKGFTLDSDTRQEYLDRLGSIQEIARLSPNQKELADRFAYGHFMLRPFSLETISFDYRKEYGAVNGFAKVQYNLKSSKGWTDAPDLKAFAQWVNDPGNPDFLVPLPTA